MLREHTNDLAKIKIFLDMSLVTASFFIGFSMANRIGDLYMPRSYIGLLPVLLFIWGVLLHYFEMYYSFRTRKISEILFVVFKTTLFSFVFFGSFIYLFKITGVSRFFICFVFILAGILISLEKVILMLFSRSARIKGYNFKRVLIVGTGKRAQRFIDLIHNHPEWGFKIIGLVDKDKSKVGEGINEYKVLGCFDDIPDIIHNQVVDEALFVVPRSWLNQIEEIMRFLELEGIRVNVAVDYFELKLSKAEQTHLNGFPMITFRTTPDKVWHLLLKRVFDITISLAGIILLWPLFLIITILIKLTSEGSIFFTQKRCGLNGRSFNLHKFRTMVADAEEILPSLMANNEINGPAFKMKGDPRVTTIGTFLRVFSLDELPQLWDVFKGDMSLVGPRPPIPEEVKRYDNWQRRRLSMRPGLTCLWQVNGRNSIVNFDDWVKLDLEYIDKWSLWLDLRIFLKTIPVVLFGIGAR